MGDVSSPFEHPTLGLLITEEQRDRAMSFLQEAYAEGRLEEPEFEDRISQALVARTRKELNSTLFGLALFPVPRAGMAHQTDQWAPTAGGNQMRSETRENVISALVHLSPLVSLFVGPLIAMLAAEKGSRVRSEARGAFLFTAVSIGLIIAVHALIPEYNDVSVIGLLVLIMGWLVGIFVGCRRSLAGKSGFTFLQISHQQQRRRR